MNINDCQRVNSISEQVLQNMPGSFVYMSLKFHLGGRPLYGLWDQVQQNYTSR